MAEKYISKITLPDGETYNLKGSAPDVSNKMDKANPTGTGSLSLNRKSGTTVGSYSVAEGSSCTASGYASHAEGSNCKSLNTGSHAEGQNCTSSGLNGSHAEGEGCTASGSHGSHAEGQDCTASEWHSHAEGWGCIASGEEQHVQGRFNIADTTSAHIVGNGVEGGERSNCHTLDWNGNAWYSGDVTVGSDATRLAKVTEISNPNLLINPDFKINQRGKTRYSTVDSNIYCVDRWKLYNGHLSEYENDAQILLVACLVPQTNVWVLSQSVENYEALKGQTVTFTVKYTAVATSSGCYRIKVYDGVTETSVAIPQSSNQTISLTHTVSGNATCLSVGVVTNSGEQRDMTIYLYWAKLEIGSVATPFVPPNVAEELPKCLRYYRTISRGCSAYIDSQCDVVIRTNFEIPMRVAPSTSLLKPIEFGYSGGGLSAPSEQSIKAQSVEADGVRWIMVDGYNTDLPKNSYVCVFTDNCIGLDAEI